MGFEMEIKFCKKCQTNKHIVDFYKKKNSFKLLPYCKSCTNFQSIERNRRFKESCVEYKGGKCEDCGYNKCIGALEFHHLDDDSKEFNISSKRNNGISDSIIKELDKCALLCANCHRERHFSKIAASYKPGKQRLYFVHKLCLCGKRINRKSTKCKKCRGKDLMVLNLKIKWPPIDVLIDLLSKHPFTTVAKQLGISDTAIRKHLRARGINPKTLLSYRDL